MNFTKGPWVAVHQPDQDAEMATVCWCADWCIGVRTPGVPGGNYRDIDWGDPAADARLIAAAPTMLNELQHLVRLLEPLERDGSLHVPGLATLNGARAAIAKAIGAA